LSPEIGEMLCSSSCIKFNADIFLLKEEDDGRGRFAGAMNVIVRYNTENRDGGILLSEFDFPSWRVVKTK